MIKIEFIAEETSEAEARGLVLFLQAVHGPGIIPAHMDPPTIINTVIKVPKEGLSPETKAALEAAATSTAQALAPDGYPTPAGMEVDTSVSPPQLVEVDRDSDGIPWDDRIHASTKTKVAAGTWTRRRNTPDDVFNAVMAELRAANTARTMEAAQALTTPPAPAPEPTAAEAFTPPANVVIPPAPTATPAPPPPGTGAAGAAGGDGGPTFPEIMKKLTAAQGAGLLTAAGIQTILTDVGLGGMAELIKAPAHIRAAVEALIPVPA